MIFSLLAFATERLCFVIDVQLFELHFYRDIVVRFEGYVTKKPAGGWNGHNQD